MASIFERRAFLKRVGQIFTSGIVVLLTLIFGRFLNRFLKETRKIEVSLTKIDSAFYVGEGFFIVKNEQGIKVLSRRCPHLGCTLQVNNGSGQIECPCHGSVFTLKGKYIRGPAKKDMRPLAFRKTDNSTLNIFL